MVANLKYNLVQLHKQVWGESSSYDLNKAKIGSGLDRDGRIAYTNKNGSSLFMPVKIGDLQLPNEPLVSVNSRKNIVTTSLFGSKRAGAVNEIISQEGYSISIRGIAINYDSTLDYPRDIIESIHNLYRKNEPLEIISPLLNLILPEENKKVIITSFNLPAMQGVQHAQAYELQCITDVEWELEL